MKVTLMNRFQYYLCCFLLLALISCSLPKQPTQLRLINQSAMPLDRVVVIFPNERITFGPLPAGAASDYQVVQHGVYRYAAYQVIVNGKAISQPVLDWVGEQPLGGLRFTYELHVDPDRPIWQQVQATVQPE